MIKLFFFAISLFFNVAQASEISAVAAPQEIEMVEKALQNELASKEYTNDKKFFIILGAAREFYIYRSYDKARQYYEQAIAQDTKENKSEAYINLLAIEFNARNKDAVQTEYARARSYFNENSKYFTEDIKSYFSLVDNYLNDDQQTNITGFYGHFSREENLISLLKKKDFERALASLNPEAIKDSKNDFAKIAYDLLVVHKNKRNIKELQCEAKFKQYPHAYTYHILLCDLLIQYLEDGQFRKDSLERTEIYFKDTDKDRAYLFEILKEIVY